MIPGKIIRFLEEQANIGFAGTRDRNFVPSGHRLSGWRSDPDGRMLTALVPEAFSDRLLDAARDNGQIALTIEQVPTHETYQFKGRYVSHRPVRRDDLELAQRTRDRFFKSLRPVYDERVATALKAAIPDPSVAVDIEVHEVFLQTPGPGAGARISPPADA